MSTSLVVDVNQRTEAALDDLVPRQRRANAVFHRIEIAADLLGELVHGHLVALGDPAEDPFDVVVVDRDVLLFGLLQLQFFVDQLFERLLFHGRERAGARAVESLLLQAHAEFLLALLEDGDDLRRAISLRLP